MAEAPADNTIAIVGAGIVGICAAARLSEAGLKVTVFDRTDICAETSSGNAAAFAFSEVLPLAHKGMIAQVPRWLLDPLGPLTIPPTYFPALAGWLFRFWRAGSSANFDRAVTAQTAMMKLARDEWMQLMDASGTRHMLREDGCLELYESEAEYRASLPSWQVREKAGIDVHHLSQQEIAQYQPGLSERFVRAVFVPGWCNVADPAEFGRAVWQYAETLGARWVKDRVTAVEHQNGVQRLKLESGGEHCTQKLVIAAGAWSHRLAAMLGDKIPLEAERGYNTTLPTDAFDLRRQISFPRHGFVISPLSSGIRVGGAVEFGGLERAPNYARSKAMLRKAADFLPGLKTTGGKEWMGHRPSLPDSLPVIDAARARGVYYAFGHGHLGLTQAAATARLIHDLVLGQKPAMPLAPFSAGRF
ncbi:MAG: FAD-binding oxidoreductase [Rhizobiaceae bacterium]|nr:FAD-binding oxidoreductase [Rhizobiaceae bacterium]